MKHWNAYIFIVLVLVFVVFTFWIGGGFDKFQEPIVIVLPEEYSGLVCVTTRAGNEAQKKLRYEVDSKGLLVIDEEMLRSHRPRIYVSGTEDRELSKNAMFPVYTETSVEDEESYTVMWVGSDATWKKFLSAQSGDQLCVGRH